MSKMVGIDPGFKGCLCLNEDSKISFFDKYILEINKKKEYDIALMIQILKDIHPDFVVIERQQSMRKQGVASTFKTGYGFGIWIGALSALSIPFTIVQARTWQKEFFPPRGDDDTKEIAYKIASQLYPQSAKEMRGPRNGLIDGRSDSVLIAEYGKRKGLKHV